MHRFDLLFYLCVWQLMWWFRNTSGVLLTRTALSIRVESGSFFSKIKHHLTPGGSTVAVTLAWMAAEHFLTFGIINQCCEILLLVVKQCLTSLSSATVLVVERGPNSPSLHLAHIYVYGSLWLSFCECLYTYTNTKVNFCYLCFLTATSSHTFPAPRYS